MRSRLCRECVNSDVAHEVRKRIGDARYTWATLGVFWKKAAFSVRWKLHIYKSVIRPKLVCGLGSVALVTVQQQRIAAFQMKGLGYILRVLHQFVDRRNANEVVLRPA